MAVRRFNPVTGAEIKVVSPGFSATALFFGPFVFLFRRMPKQFFVWLGLGIAWVLAWTLIEVIGGFQFPNLVDKGIGVVFWGFLGIRINDITARENARRGYDVERS